MKRLEKDGQKWPSFLFPANMLNPSANDGRIRYIAVRSVEERIVVDRQARDLLAENLRHLVAGQITNDEFEDAAPRDSADPAVEAVFWFAWGLYGDVRAYRLIGGNRVHPLERQAAITAIAFLKSNLEYRDVRLPEIRAPWRMDRAMLCFTAISFFVVPGCLAATFPSSLLLVLGWAIVGVAIALLMRWADRNDRQHMQRELAAFTAHHQLNIWPFACQGDLDGVREMPVYLAGRHQAP